jgi:hypothetical protein
VCDNCVLGVDDDDDTGAYVDEARPGKQKLIVQDEERCMICWPLGCDDPDAHLGVPSKYTPLKNRGCICGADVTGADCMCFE